MWCFGSAWIAKGRQGVRVQLGIPKSVKSEKTWSYPLDLHQLLVRGHSALVCPNTS